MAGYFYRFFGIDDLNVGAKRFIARYTIMLSAYSFISMLTSTFFILYALVILNEDFILLGAILAAQNVIQAVLDYPTGAIGDWIGQKWILSTAAICYSVGFIVLASASDFILLFLAFAILALAQSQESGAFGAWFDNNYKLYAVEDTDRRVFMEYSAKFAMITRIIIASSFIFGGVIVATFSRSFVFLVQGIVIGLFSIIFLLFVHDHPRINRSKPNFRSYFSLLGEGITGTLSNRTLRILLLGVMLSASGMAIWGNFILFPMYESYGKTDDWTGLLRSIVFIVWAIDIGFAGIIVKRIRNPQKMLIFTTIISETFFFWIFFIILTLFPAPTGSSIDFVKFGIIIMTFLIVNIPYSLQSVLMSRFYLEIIPDKNRNSVYSLIPTIILLASTITISIGGVLIEILGIMTMILVLSFWMLFSGLIKGFAIIKHESRKVLNENIEIMA
ncbi:MAG: MFS transporter [Candidatus Hodarchaeales archaeon]